MCWRREEINAANNWNFQIPKFRTKVAQRLFQPGVFRREFEEFEG